MYTYNRDGSLKQQTNPSGRVLTFTYDNAGRIANAAGQIGAEPVTNYASSFGYAPHGAVKQLTLGNGLLESSQFNSRLQPTQLQAGSLLTLDFTYNPAGQSQKNNGNVHEQKITAPGLPGGFLTQTYSYDEVNRLASVVEGGWSRSYGYDAYGNRWVSGAVGHTLPNSTPTAQTDFSSSTNRLLKNAAAFDNAGNLLGESLLGTMAYDADNRQTSFTDPVTSAVTTYAYDGGGNRVKKVTPTGTTLYVYDAFGNLAAEYADAAPLAAPGTHYRTTDHLGSTRLVTDYTAGVISRRDFFPFGEEILGSATFGNRDLVKDGQTTTTYNDPSGYRQQFTGQERDSESGFDYSGARYFSASLGRFTGADAPFADQHASDPQSWNLYAYVRNNPLAHVDTTGEACSALNNGSGYCQRADLYGNFDALVGSKTRFFAAASAASQALANVAVPGLGRVGTSPKTRAFLENTGQALERVNTEVVGKIMSGQMSGSGPALDAKLVHLEQTAVQKGLDGLKRTDATAYGTAIKEVNVLLNSKGGAGLSVLAGGSQIIFGTDEAYAQVLGGVRKSLGHDIDFANQKDREAIGNALVNHVRQTNGCDVAGDRINGCR